MVIEEDIKEFDRIMVLGKNGDTNQNIDVKTDKNVNSVVKNNQNNGPFHPIKKFCLLALIAILGYMLTACVNKDPEENQQGENQQGENQQGENQQGENQQGKETQEEIVNELIKIVENQYKDHKIFSSSQETVIETNGKKTTQKQITAADPLTYTMYTLNEDGSYAEIVYTNQAITKYGNEAMCTENRVSENKLKKAFVEQYNEKYLKDFFNLFNFSKSQNGSYVGKRQSTGSILAEYEFFIENNKIVKFIFTEKVYDLKVDDENKTLEKITTITSNYSNLERDEYIKNYKDNLNALFNDENITFTWQGRTMNEGMKSETLKMMDIDKLRTNPNPETFVWDEKSTNPVSLNLGEGFTVYF